MSDNPEVKQTQPPGAPEIKEGMPRKEIRKKLRAKAKEVHFQDKLLAEWMNQLADKI